MIVTKAQTVESQVPTAYRCDVCGDERPVNDEAMLAQEFLHIRRHAGYASHFGDGNRIELDVCDSCQWAMLGSYFLAKLEPET